MNGFNGCAHSSRQRRLIDVKHFSGRRPFPLLGAPSIHRLLRCAHLPLRGLQPIARQIQLQDDAVMNQAVDGCSGRHGILEVFMMPLFLIA